MTFNWNIAYLDLCWFAVGVFKYILLDHLKDFIFKLQFRIQKILYNCAWTFSYQYSRQLLCLLTFRIVPYHTNIFSVASKKSPQFWCTFYFVSWATLGVGIFEPSGIPIPPTNKNYFFVITWKVFNVIPPSIIFYLTIYREGWLHIFILHISFIVVKHNSSIIACIQTFAPALLLC